MADFFEGAGHATGVTGAGQALAELTVADLMPSPPKAVRPTWMLTRFPVLMDEFQQLKMRAATPTRPAATMQEDAGQAAAAVADAAIERDLPEDVPSQAAVPGPGPLAPAIGASFDGIGATAWMPPDCTCAVGPQHVLLAVNTDLVGYNKSGTQLFRWPNMTALFKNVLPSGASIFDPRLAYDQYSNRWIVVAAARRQSPAGSWAMIGVSQTPDPAGAFWVWALDSSLNGSTPTNNWSDFPMLGFDAQGIYITFNMFEINGGFQYAKLRILNKAELYAGGTPPNHNVRWYDFWNLRDLNNQVAFTVQPCMHFRGVGGNPPAYLINALWDKGNYLTLWTLGDPIGYWHGRVPSLARASVPCTAYSLPPQAAQSGTTTPINTDDNRLHSAVFQNAGNQQRVWACHTVGHSWPGQPAAQSIIQWYEVDVPTNTVAQQGGFGAPGAFYFYPAIQPDLSRNAYVVFGRSSAQEFASFRSTGRRVSDPAGTLQASALVKAGMSSYLGGRWGDYFTTCRDGADSSRIWGYGEYADARNQWGTWVVSMKF